MSGENSKSKESTWKGMISQHKKIINIGKFKDLSDLYDGCDFTRKEVCSVCGSEFAAHTTSRGRQFNGRN